MTDVANVASYGSWPSPLSAAALAAGGVRIGGAASRGDEIWWSELRPAEQGRSVVVGRPSIDRPAADVLTGSWSARTRVHEYGGGAWWLGVDHLYFAHWDDQRLYRLGTDSGDPEPITVAPPTAAGWRFADGREHPSEPWLVCVRERHEAELDEAVNELVALDLAAVDGSDGVAPVILGNGPDPSVPRSDFVAAPRFSPDGRWLSWIQWNHPRMPWDGTELCVAPVFAGMRLGNIQVVAGNDSEAIHGADWTADGRLVFSTDRAGYWNLHNWTPTSSSETTLTALDGSEIGGPQWVFGLQRWTELSDGRLAVIVTADAADHLAVVDGTGAVTPLPGSAVADLVEIDDLVATERNTLLVHGASATSLAELIEVDADGEAVAVHRPADDLGIDPSWFSLARSVRYASGDGREAQAFVYEPAGPGLAGPAEERPPLVVMGHGGPTAHASPALNLRIQYWTSRGFAVADVNYGGSSGFGRAYRQLLNDSWGIVDVEDCIAIAEHLAVEGTVDRARMAIRGGSAGGFTVLSALATSDVFGAGTNLFGVADLSALARDTHKFESRYLDGLIGPYPERQDLYDERSPINHTDGLSCPLLVLQGTEDEIVPPNQSEAIVAAVAAKGIPHAYVTFEGEQHGFRQEANIIRSYELELWFYGAVFGIDIADQIEPPSTWSS